MKNNPKIALLFFLVTFPFVFLLLPANFFDNGKPICLSQLLAGRECFGCGITRGIMHLIHLELEEAFAYNMLSFIVLPLLCLIWIQWFIKELKLYIFIKQKRNDKLNSNIVKLRIQAAMETPTTANRQDCSPH